MRESVKSMYRRNPLGKKTCKPYDTCCFALYQLTASLREVPSSFVLILSARVPHARGRWEHPGVFSSALLWICYLFSQAPNSFVHVVTFRKFILLIVDCVLELVLIGNPDIKSYPTFEMIQGV
jgi:hypothetical protein